MGYKDPIRRRRQKANAQARYRRSQKGQETKKRYKTSKAGRASKVRYVKKWRDRNKIKHKAHLMVLYAVRMGRLTRKPCEICKDINVHAHHDDYFKPLDVRWLCQKHHNEIHCFPRYKEVVGRQVGL